MVQLQDRLRGLRRELSVSIRGSIRKQRPTPDASSAPNQKGRSKGSQPSPFHPSAILSSRLELDGPPSLTESLPHSHSQIQSDSPPSNSTSRKPTLLTLPREIRDQIWTYLLGDHVLHVGNSSTRRITHIVCSAPISDALARDVYSLHNTSSSSSTPTRNLSTSSSTSSTSDSTSTSAASNSSPPLQPRTLVDSKVLLPPGQNTHDTRINDSRLAVHQFRHSSCFTDSWKLAAVPSTPQPYPPALVETIERCQLGLSVMRTCKQLYAETFTVLWSQNSWGFAKGITFVKFVQTRTRAQRDAIRHVVLKPYDVLREAREQSSFTQPPRGQFGMIERVQYSVGLDMLKGLRSVCLIADWRVRLDTLEMLWCEGQAEEEEGAMGELVDDLKRIQGLREARVCVQCLEVVLPDRPRMGSRVEMPRCTQMISAWRGLVERRILGGAAIDVGGHMGTVGEMSEDERQLRRMQFEKWKREQ